VFSCKQIIISRFWGSKELMSSVTTLPDAENNLSDGAEEPGIHRHFIKD